MRTFIGICVALFCIDCRFKNGDSATSPIDTASPSDIQRVATDYRQLTLMTKEPVYVNPGLAALCRGATQADVEAAQKTAGPHANTAVKIYMNESAAETFATSGAMYPVGAIIVKEKDALGYRADNGGFIKPHNGVGGMIKRAAGYDSGHGDWEYFYFEEPTKIESGRISSCIDCHGGVASHDHVFGSWATAKTE